MLLCFILSFLNSGGAQLKLKYKHIQMYMSVNNINMIISETTAIVRVRFVDHWATNNIFHWLNWTPLVNWYALKIRPRKSGKEQNYSSKVS